MAGAAADRRAMTRGRAGDGGVASMRAPLGCSSRPTFHESGAACTVRPSFRCRGQRHDVGHTRDFDAMAAWLAVRTSKSATCQLLRVAWRTVGSIITRVNNDVEATVDRLAGLRRIGIDEISCNNAGSAT